MTVLWDVETAFVVKWLCPHTGVFRGFGGVYRVQSNESDAESKNSDLAGLTIYKIFVTI